MPGNLEGLTDGPGLLEGAYTSGGCLCERAQLMAIVFVMMGTSFLVVQRLKRA